MVVDTTCEHPSGALLERLWSARVSGRGKVHGLWALSLECQVSILPVVDIASDATMALFGRARRARATSWVFFCIIP